MLIIRRCDDGRLRLSNNRQSDTAHDEAEARRKLYRWGHTDLSINKALAEMRTGAGAAPARPGWRVVRPSDAVPEARTAPVSQPEPEEERMEEKPRKRTRRAAPAAAPPAPKEAEPAKKPARKRASRPAPRSGTEGKDPAAEALESFRAGAAALRSIEAAQLPFARGPWTELREKAEQIVACLQGKRPPGS